MTAPLTMCPACNEGLVRFDPQTGETRCSNCWASGDVPLVAGGQGRSAAEVRETAKGCGLLLAFAGIVALAVVAAGVWS